jgi:hypothetical protein
MADNQTTCATPLTTPTYGIRNRQAFYQPTPEPMRLYELLTLELLPAIMVSMHREQLFHSLADPKGI